MINCPYCIQEVQEAATKCPHCHEWLKPWSKGGPHRKTIQFVLLFSLFFGSITGVELYYKFALKETLKPADPRDVVITRSERKIVGSSVSIVGKVKNKTSKPIRGLTVEATFYDKNNKVVDVGQDYISGDLEGNATRAFKITFSCGVKDANPDVYDHFTLVAR